MDSFESWVSSRGRALSATGAYESIGALLMVTLLAIRLRATDRARPVPPLAHAFLTRAHHRRPRRPAPPGDLGRPKAGALSAFGAFAPILLCRRLAPRWRRQAGLA